jgi:hypothetical protein
MSCCGERPYHLACRQDLPYPSISHESVPSQIDNLTLALFGQVTKSVEEGKIIWSIPCDPFSSATIQGVPRILGEGLLCYLLRVIGQLGAVWGIWNADTSYPAKATVTDETSLFQAIQYVPCGTLLSNTSYWTQLTNVI